MTEREPVTKIREDIYQVRLPLPFALNHVNVYLLRGDKGWTLVDTGIHWQAGEDTWAYAFEKLEFSPKDFEKIILTHTHPDHFGMAGYLQGLAKAAGRAVPIYASAREDQQADIVWRNGKDYHFGAWLRRNGLPEDMANTVNDAMGNTYHMTLPHPAPMHILQAGETVQMGAREFLMIHAPGHSDGQLLFYDAGDKLLLSGDHVLMKITPNIGLWEQSDPNPLGNFMQSLAELKALDVHVALPGHRNLIEDWQGRIAELLGHHEERLGFALEAVQQGAKTPYEVALHIFETSRFSSHEWRFAIAETLSHLEYLRLAEKIVQDETSLGFAEA